MSIIQFEAVQLKTKSRKTNARDRPKNLATAIVHFLFSFEKNNQFLSFCKVKATADLQSVVCPARAIKQVDKP